MTDVPFRMCGVRKPEARWRRLMRGMSWKIVVLAIVGSVAPVLAFDGGDSQVRNCTWCHGAGAGLHRGAAASRSAF